jgi:beta-phosphoglucomutase
VILQDIRAVLFDLDGVLIDSPPVHIWSWGEVLRPFNITVPAERLHREEGRKAEEIARNIFADNHVEISDADLNILIQRKRELYRSRAPADLTEDAVIVINKLRNKGWFTGLVSGSARSNLLTVLNEARLSLFDVVLTAESYGLSKPHPEPYLTGCRKLHLHPENCIAVENAPLGIQSAKSAGLKVIALTSTLPVSELPGADEYIEKLIDLTGILGVK